MLVKYLKDMTSMPPLATDLLNNCPQIWEQHLVGLQHLLDVAWRQVWVCENLWEGNIKHLLYIMLLVHSGGGGS